MPPLTSRKRAFLFRQLDELTLRSLAHSRAEQTLADAVEAALPAPHKTMIRRGFGAHLQRATYCVADVWARSFAGVNEAALGMNAALVRKLRSQYPARLRNFHPDMSAVYTHLRQLCPDRITEAKLIAKAPELAALIDDASWQAADKAKLRCALLKAGWPLP